MKQTLTLALAAVLLATVAYVGFGGGGGGGGGGADTAEESAPDSPEVSADPDDSGDADSTEARPADDPIALANFSCPDVNPATEIVFVYSVEKEGLMDRVVAGFNELEPGCGRITGHAIPSGVQMSRLASNWPVENDGVPPPHLASPSTSLWAIEANALADQRGHAVSVEPENAASLGWAPLVAAMPESVQQQIAPDRSISLEELAEWSGRQVGDNDFVLRKNNPEIASTGLMAMLAPYAVAADLNTLTTDTLSDAEDAVGLAIALEDATPVYGRTSLTVLEAMCEVDAQGRSPAEIVSVVLTEEQLVVDYNRGTGDFGCENTGRPAEQLIAVYLDGPTPVSEHPLLQVDAPWVTDAQRSVAEAFVAYATDPEVLDIVRLELGVRDEQGRFPIEDPTLVGIAPELDPSGFENRPMPTAEAIAAVRTQWNQIRQPFNVHLLIDTSGSMGQPAGFEGVDSTRLEAVQEAIAGFADALVGPDDTLSLTTFPAPQEGLTTQIQTGPIRPNAAGSLIEEIIDQMTASGATPLYEAIDETYRRLAAAADESDGIDVLIVLTDGLNETDIPREDMDQDEIDADTALGQEVAAALGRLASQTAADDRLRIFTIAYGPEAITGSEVLGAFASQTFGQDLQSGTTEINVILRSIISLV